MNRILKTFAMTLVAMLVMSSVAVAQGNSGKNGNNGNGNGNRTAEGELTQECEDGTVVYAGPTEIWPPNHKDVNGTLSFMPDESNEEEYAYRFSGRHEQGDTENGELNGSGNTPIGSDITFTERDNADAMTIGFGQEEMGMATNTTTVYDVTLRAERSGRDKGGRTYTIAGSVHEGFGDEVEDSDEDEACAFSFEIFVPHDQGNANNGDRPVTDSFVMLGVR